MYEVCATLKGRYGATVHVLERFPSLGTATAFAEGYRLPADSTFNWAHCYIRKSSKTVWESPIEVSRTGIACPH